LVQTTIERTVGFAEHYSRQLRWSAIAVLVMTALVIFVPQLAPMPEELRFEHVPSFLLAILAGLLSLVVVELLGLELGDNKPICCVRSAISLVMIVFAASKLYSFFV
jgi:hypothetical protein